MRRRARVGSASPARQGFSVGPSLLPSSRGGPSASLETSANEWLTRALPLVSPFSSQGGVSGSIAKTATAPIERVKLLIQTQDANPKVRFS